MKPIELGYSAAFPLVILTFLALLTEKRSKQAFGNLWVLSWWLFFVQSMYVKWACGLLWVGVSKEEGVLTDK